jgi:hypothetical protein
MLSGGTQKTPGVPGARLADFQPKIWKFPEYLAKSCGKSLSDALWFPGYMRKYWWFY